MDEMTATPAERIPRGSVADARRTAIEDAPDRDLFPVVRKPPASWYWPSRVRALRIRDERIRKVGRAILRDNPRLADPRFRLALQSLAIVTLYIEDAHEVLRQRGIANPETGELRAASVGVLDRLIRTQAQLMRELQLTPTALSEAGQARTEVLEAAFQRIERARAERDRQDAERNAAPEEPSGDG